MARLDFDATNPEARSPILNPKPPAPDQTIAPPVAKHNPYLPPGYVKQTLPENLVIPTQANGLIKPLGVDNQTTEYQKLVEIMSKVPTAQEPHVMVGDITREEAMENIVRYIHEQLMLTIPHEIRVTKEDIDELRNEILHDSMTNNGYKFLSLSAQHKGLINRANIQWRTVTAFRLPISSLYSQISSEFNDIYHYAKNTTPARLVKGATRPESGASAGDRGVTHSNPLLAMLTGVKMAHSEEGGGGKRNTHTDELTTPEELALAREMGLL